MKCIIHISKTKTFISYAFVFAYAKCCFSHDAAKSVDPVPVVDLSKLQIVLFCKVNDMLTEINNCQNLIR